MPLLYLKELCSLKALNTMDILFIKLSRALDYLVLIYRIISEMDVDLGLRSNFVPKFLNMDLRVKSFHNNILKYYVPPCEGSPTRWTDDLVKVAGSRWMKAAQDRSSWRTLG
jgi:hypothetical protein